MADKKYAGESGLSAVFAAIKSAINEKVTKVSGKELSTNDYTDHDKNLVNTMEPYLDTVYIGASGNPIVVQAQDAPVLGLDVAIGPIQDLHGYDKPWVGGSNKNLLPMRIDKMKGINKDGTWNGNTYTHEGVTYTLIPDETLTYYTEVRVSGTATGRSILYLYKVYSDPSEYNEAIPNTANQTITFSGFNGTGRTYAYKDTSWHTVTNPTNNISSTGITDLWTDIANGTTTNFTIKPQIELGSSATSYVPYANICPISGRTAVVVDDVGKNFLKRIGNTVTINGVTLTFNDNGTITANGTSTDYVWLTTAYIGGQSYNLDKSKNYILSGCPSGFGNNGGLQLRDLSSEQNNALYIGTGSDKQWINDNGSGFTIDADNIYDNNGNSIDINASTTVIGLRINPNVTVNNLVFRPMLRLTDVTDAEYEPYAHSSATIQLGQTVYGADINWDTGVATVTGDNVNFGNLNWVYENGYFRTQSTLSNCKTIGAMELGNTEFSAFKKVSFNEWYNNRVDGTACIGSDNRIYLTCNSYTDAATFKTAMTGQTVFYELATPIELTLTPTVVQMLKGYNYITGDGDMSIMYVPESILPTPPTADGTYKLICTVSDGVLVFSWESDS